jgi:hypothetical protein
MKGNLYLIIVLIFAQSLTLFGQTGTLRGRIIDAETGESLIGATVMVTASTKGSITDFDGNYILTGLDPGIYSVTVQYVSYEPQVFPEVAITAGKVAVLDVNLGHQLLDIEEVQVVARQRHVPKLPCRLCNGNRQRSSTEFLWKEGNSYMYVDSVTGTARLH